MLLPQPSEGFAWVQAAAGPALVCRPLESLASHLFSTRIWPLGSAVADDERAWSDVAEAIGVEPDRLRRLRQVHGQTVVVSRRERLTADAGAPRQATGVLERAARPDADIILSDDPSVAVVVQSADCVPILMADRRGSRVAAAHAGWRGLAAGVPRVLVEAMMREFGCRPADLMAAMGPSISAARYEVGPDVYAEFARGGFDRLRLDAWFSPSTRADHWRFDGAASARDQLVDAGVPRESIHTAGLCTASFPDVFCSYRRDGTGAGRMAAAICARRADATVDARVDP